MGRPSRRSPPRPPHPLRWLIEPLEEDPTFLEKPMFGCLAAYLEGRLVLLLSEGEEPWNGVLVATSREHHPALLESFPALREHPVLGKWLYISQHHNKFEETVLKIVEKIVGGNVLIGVEPRPRKPRGARKPARKQVRR